MTPSAPDIRTVTIERDFPHPPERLWRALTQPELLAEWLMASDFAPIPGHAFRFTADWGGVDGTVEAIEPNRRLRYTWNAFGLESTVTWTLTPSATGTTLRMDQTGFRRHQSQAFHGAQAGWHNFYGQLEQLLDRME